jgi:hypothetical protein
MRGPSTRSTTSFDQAVVQQQHGAARNILRQLLVIEADAFGVAELAFGVENELLAGFQRNLAVRELADADLRSLQVRHDRDLGAELVRASRTIRARPT